MDIEEVKKILRKLFWEARAFPHNEPVDIEAKFTELADQICQLFEPKPDENRLLTDEDLIKISDRYIGSPMAAQIATRDAQVAKTTSILKAQEQARVERIVKDVEKEFIWGQVPVYDPAKGATEWTMHCISDKDWQALKGKLLKQEVRND